MAAHDDQRFAGSRRAQGLPNQSNHLVRHFRRSICHMDAGRRQAVDPGIPQSGMMYVDDRADRAGRGVKGCMGEGFGRSRDRSATLKGVRIEVIPGDRREMLGTQLSMIACC